jgi:hypothetical protein
MDVLNITTKHNVQQLLKVRGIFEHISGFEFFLLTSGVHSCLGVVVEPVETHSPLAGGWAA